MDRTDTYRLKKQIRSYIPLLSTADLCRRNAVRFPDKEALVDYRQRITWGDVLVLSNKLALTLRDIGLNKERPLLVQLPNCAELFLARLACEKAGVACVTASPYFRAAELKQIIQHTKAGAVLIVDRYRNTDFYQVMTETGYAGELEFGVVEESVMNRP